MENKRYFFMLYLLLILLSCLQIQGLSTDRFYPFGNAVRDRKLPPNDDGSSGELPISVSLPFFQNTYGKLFVNTNGVISFIANLEEFTPDAFPVDNGRRLIAPYWADVDARNGGNIFYRESRDLEILQRATSDVKESFPRQFRSFRASWTFIATWYNVSHYITTRRRGEVGRRPSNTFQVVLISNGRHSFAIFLYNKTEWTTGDASKGANGQGGIPAQAGFNYGDGNRYYSIRGSRTSLVKELPTLTNVGVPGKFVFRIDEAQISKGGCNTGGGLTLSPRFGLVLGGTLISFSGPCFNTSDVIVCRFNGNITVEGYYESEYKAVCVSPPVGKIGRIPVELSLNNGSTFNFSTFFSSVPLGRHGPEISGIVAKDWYNLSPNFLGWNPLHVKDMKVQIEVVKFDWNTLEMLGKPILVKENVDNYGFDIVSDLVASAMPMPGISSNNESEALLSPLAAVSIRAQNPKRGLPARIYSAPFLTIPANITNELKDIFDKMGIYHECKQWFGNDMTDFNKLRDELISCPQSLEQAETDNGRFVSDDVCKPPRTTSCSVYHNGSYHCFRSRFPSRSGAGQQCCYNKEGHLMVGPRAGGTIDKYHPKSSQFSTLRHLKEDIYPWFLCCRLCRKCGLYYENRPSDDGSGYRAPEISTMFGDPHLITLDGLSYTFNGYGVYTMLNIEENGFVLQARMQPLISENGAESRGTFLIAFALKDRDSDTVQIELNSLKMLDIYVNKEEEFFEPEVKEMDFEGLILAQRNDSIIQIVFTSGIVVNVKQDDVSLSFDVLLPKTFKGKTKGLLGIWDGVKENDFTSPTGKTIDIASNASQIHWKFGQTWMVNADHSLFVYPDDKEHKEFVNKKYQPLFLDVKNLKFKDKDLEKKARELCQGVKECLFDIIASGKISFGNTTKHAIQDYNVKKKNINTVRDPIYFNCNELRVKDRCDACGSACPKTLSTLGIALSVLITITAAALVLVAALYFFYRKIRQEPKVIEKEKPTPPAVPPRKKHQPNIAPSAMTNMVFVLPALPPSRNINK